MNPHGRYKRAPNLSGHADATEMARARRALWDPPSEPATPVVTPIITTCPSCEDIELHWTEYPATACAFPAEHIRDCEACRQYTADENAALARLYRANIDLLAALDDRIDPYTGHYQHVIPNMGEKG